MRRWVCNGWCIARQIKVSVERLGAPGAGNVKKLQDIDPPRESAPRRRVAVRPCGYEALAPESECIRASSRKSARTVRHLRECQLRRNESCQAAFCASQGPNRYKPSRGYSTICPCANSSNGSGMCHSPLRSGARTRSAVGFRLFLFVEAGLFIVFRELFASLVFIGNVLFAFAHAYRAHKHQWRKLDLNIGLGSQRKPN